MHPFATVCFHKAYIQRDTGTYQNLLKDFLARYKTLDNADQKTFGGIINRFE